MKILITENQLDKIVMKYITKEFNNLRKRKFSESEVVNWIGNGYIDAQLYRSIVDRKIHFAIYPSFSIPIKEMFNLDTKQLQKIFNEWAKNSGIEYEVFSDLRHV